VVDFFIGWTFIIICLQELIEFFTSPHSLRSARTIPYPCNENSDLILNMFLKNVFVTRQ
jgi:hypothetical protein